MMTFTNVAREVWPFSNSNTESDSTSLAQWSGQSETDLAWQEAIDKLHYWRRHPDELRIDDLEPASPLIIETAIRQCRSWAECGPLEMPVPMVAPSGEGGIIFEWRRDHFLTQLELQRDGSYEVIILKNNSVVHREVLS